MEAIHLSGAPTQTNEKAPDEIAPPIEAAVPPGPPCDGRPVSSRVEGNDLHVDSRLLPPPMHARRIRVRVRSLGHEAPRIAFDPERD
jgi:hypothetical protein